MKAKTICGPSVLLLSLVMIILLTPLVQTSYGDNDTIVVSATNENKVVLFNISSGTDSPAIYGFIITIYGHGHYSEITKSPDGWASGIIGNQAVIWTTQSHPIQPGSSEGNFAIEVTQASIYNIGWSVTDNTLKPVAWGTITITVS